MLCEAGDGEELVTCDIDLSEKETVRQRLPILQGTRSDLYRTVWAERSKL